MGEKLSLRRRVYNGTMTVLVRLGAALTCGLLLFLIGYIFYRGIPGLSWEILTTQTSYIKNTVGILPNILNTLYIILVAMALVLPIGVGAAIYLTEYARSARLVRVIEFATETLTGIPSIIFGLVGMLFFVQKMGLQAGVLAGYPVVDVKVNLYDGSYHEVDSSEMAFKIAGSMAFKDAMKKADPVLTEPIMKVVVVTPDDYMGDVIGDLNSRRGQIQGFEARSGAQQIDAFVPLAEMFGYATDLRSRTQGRGQYTMEPSHYIEIPKSIQEKIIDQRTGRHMS